MHLLRMAGADRPEQLPPPRHLPDDWVPVWSDLARVRGALDEALAHLQLLREQLQQQDEPLLLIFNDLQWQTFEAASLARRFYLTQIDRLAGATPARSQPTSQHDHGHAPAHPEPPP